VRVITSTSVMDQPYECSIEGMPYRTLSLSARMVVIPRNQSCVGFRVRRFRVWRRREKAGACFPSVVVMRCDTWSARGVQKEKERRGPTRVADRPKPDLSHHSEHFKPRPRSGVRVWEALYM
jgi:hypothetical protein